MDDNCRTIEIPCISNDGRGASQFISRHIELYGEPERMLSEQQAAENFRMRRSHSDYVSDWHVAGDPTLLIVLAGTIRIELRNTQTRDFTTGEMFVAEDYLREGIAQDDQLHGHRAVVIGAQELSVLHLKLEKRD